MQKNILLTFDYELFLGSKSGTVENCLLKPTNEILKLLNKYKAKAVFFVDTAYLLRLKELSDTNIQVKNDFKLILAQLSQIAASGHYLYHHIHSHWLDAEYNNIKNQWSLKKMTKYAFRSINEAERNMLFDFSDKILTEIIQDAKAKHSPEGFRAGGLFIEPFSYFEPFFYKHNINCDFSVLPGEAFNGNIGSFDFTKSPNFPYRFSANASEEDDLGNFYEFPITRIKVQGLYKIINSIYYRLTKQKADQKPYGDGVSATFVDYRDKNSETAKQYFFHYLVLSIESLNPVLLFLYKQKIKHNKYIHFLSHPKLVSKMSLIQMDKLLGFCHKKFTVDYEFKNFILNKS